MKQDLLLSVIVPVYNAAPYLRKCVDSILCQTYRNLEIILVADSGSKDNSVEICEAYAEQDTRIKVLQRPHEGLVSARKAGVQAASGAYIAYVDSDDWIDQGAYERLISETINSYAPDVVIYGFKEEYRGKAFICQCQVPAGYYDAGGMAENVYPRLLGLRHIDQTEALPNTEYDAATMAGHEARCVHHPEIYSSVWSKLVKRDLLAQTQNMVPDDVTMGEDLVCTVYTLLSARSLVVTDYAPYHYQKRDDSASLSNTSFQPYQIMFDAACSAVQNSPMREIHLTQLYRTLLDYVLLTNYEALLEDGFSNLPFGELDGCRVALYGAGKFGQEVYRKTKAVFPDQIALWVDRNCGAYQKAGLPVEPVETLLTEACDVIAVAILDELVCEGIKRDLTAMGISSEKIRYVTASAEMLEAVKKIMGKNSRILSS